MSPKNGFARFFHRIFDHKKEKTDQPQVNPIPSSTTPNAQAIHTKRPPLSVSIREQLVGIHARASAEGKKVVQATASSLEVIAEAESDTVEVVENHLKADKTTKVPRLQNIFASPLDLTAAFIPPVHTKTTAQSEFIRNALADNFVFDSLQTAEMKTLIDAFEHFSVPITGTTIITQGEVGDFFYILENGGISFHVNGVHVGDAITGQTFGELALLYNCPRAATCISTVSGVTLWRVDQETFRRILASHTQSREKEILNLLRQVDIFADHLDDVYLNKLVDAVSIMSFENGEVILRKGDPGRAFYILKSGKIKISDIDVGGIKYEDNILDIPGSYLGERALLTEEPRVANAVAIEDNTVVLCIPISEFVQVLGPYKDLVLRSNDVKILNGIPTFARSSLSSKEKAEISHLIEPDVTITDVGAIIYERSKPIAAALYIVRSGAIKLIKAGSTNDDSANAIISTGGYFGLESFFSEEKDVIATMTAMAVETPLVLAKLSIESILSIALDQARLYRPDNETATQIPQDVKLMRKSEIFKSLVRPAVDDRGVYEPQSIRNLDDLVKKRILGCGTFGRVWLVSTKKNHSNAKATQAYALKVQYKRELLSNHQVDGVIREKQIMESLDHPFIIRLISSFQDESCVYMVLTLVQGGELYALMDDGKKLPEKDARFYAACILESLGFMHNRSILYRDLKPENVLLAVDGYAILVDLGFAKIVQEKTYTLCGTPLYLAPEVILSRGHDKGCDYWSWAVLLFEMILGRNPFYKNGMDQITLFKSIVQGKFHYYPDERALISPEAIDLIGKILVVKSAQRLGNLPGGDMNVRRHPFFSDFFFDHSKLLKKELKAPYVPKVKDAFDASAFESWKNEEDDDKLMKKKLVPLSNVEQAKFIKFDEPLHVVDDCL